MMKHTGWKRFISTDTLSFGFRFTPQHQESGIMWKWILLLQREQILLLWMQRAWGSECLEIWRKSGLPFLFPAHMSLSGNYPAPAIFDYHCCPHADLFDKLNETAAHSVSNTLLRWSPASLQLKESFRSTCRLVLLVLFPPFVFGPASSAAVVIQTPAVIKAVVMKMPFLALFIKNHKLPCLQL